MSSETFTSGGNTYKITIYPAPPDGKKYPVVFLLHGNFGLGFPYGDQIQSFAKDIASRGYIAAVPQYYQDDEPHPLDIDTVSKVQIVNDAISMVASRLQADHDRLGLIGFSLGASTVMTFISSNPLAEVKVLADFFGFNTKEIQDGISSFPPTIIFHNKNDQIVPVQNSEEIDRLLPSTIKHKLVIYDEKWPEGRNHAFKPDGNSDVDSRLKTVDWFTKHLPPTGI
jgi:carboxymethylenebutenolidase